MFQNQADVFELARPIRQFQKPSSYRRDMHFHAVLIRLLLRQPQIAARVEIIVRLSLLKSKKLRDLPTRHWILVQPFHQ